MSEKTKKKNGGVSKKQSVLYVKPGYEHSVENGLVLSSLVDPFLAGFKNGNVLITLRFDSLGAEGVGVVHCERVFGEGEPINHVTEAEPKKRYIQ